MALNSEKNIPRALLNHYGRIGMHAAKPVLFDGPGTIGHQAFGEALQRAPDPDTRRALHINLPFCPVRCLNCENDSIITHDGRKIDRYIDGIEREAELLIATLGFRPRLQQIHLGGGSPNYLVDRQLVRLMGIVDEHFVIDDETEQSLDANPKRTSPSQLNLLRGLGFDRISLSIRDLDPSVQLAIGRTLSVDMIRDVFDNARDAGFKTIETDVMYGLPCQTTEGINRTLDALMALSPDRIACFAFSRKAAERAHQSALDHCTMPSIADKLAIFNSIVRGLAGEYAWIGLDSFAKHDDELTVAQTEKRLFKSWTGYSHLPNAQAHGLGVGAISDLDDICVQNHADVGQWSDALDQEEFPIRGGTALGDHHRAQRDAIRALMCNMELHDYAALFDDSQWPEGTWKNYAQEGIVTIDDGVMRVTDEGRFMLPQILTH
jgi:oxygen-independent coproporphyrinogen-3 oxidase